MLDIFGMLLVGDGALTLLDPKRHCLLWEVGPGPCRDFVDEFVQHPTASRWVGLAEIVVGAWIAEQQKPGLEESLRRW